MIDVLFMEEERKPVNGRIRLESMYPYTFVRANVMRTKLLSRLDYDKLLRMSFSEIARFLQDTEYKQEIDELSVKYGGVELLEISMGRNLARTFRKLRRISPQELVQLIDAYLMKYDILNIKTIIRGIYTKSDANYVRKLLIHAGTLGEELYDELLKKDSVEEIIRIVPFLVYKDFHKQVESLKEKGQLFELENSLDKYYYNYITQFSEKIPSQGTLFREFLLSEIEVTNILTIVRMMREKADRNEIRRHIFLTGNRRPDHDMLKLLDARGIEEIPELVSNKGLRACLHKSIESYKEKKSLMEFERQLSKFMLEKASLFAHQHPLSIDVILGYMFAKEIEVRNLMKLIKGKELGLGEKLIEAEIVA